jgi:cell division protein FtsB
MAEGCLMDPTTLGRTAVTLAVLLGSLGLVTWRQSRALETLAELDAIRQSASVASAQAVELDREIQVLTSRATVVPAARARLGMHMPGASELEILELGGGESTP